MNKNDRIAFKEAHLNEWREYRGEESILFNSHCRGKEMVLSNMYPCFLEYDGKIFNSVDHLFHWLLFDGAGMEKVREKIFKCTGVCSGFEAMKIRRKYNALLNPEGLEKREWRTLKLCHQIKAQCCREFRDMLIESEGKNLVEFAYWGDVNYGVVYNNETGLYEGRNCSGRIMMKVREDVLKEEREKAL